MVETILQHWVFRRFALPFLLIFFAVFAILEKTGLFGTDKKQLNALIAFIVGLMVISVTYPVEVINNLILFLTVSIIAVFAALLLWGFIAGEAKVEGKGVKTFFGIVVIIVIIGAVFWATGLFMPFIDLLFKQEWSYTFWVNFLFIVVIALALAVVLKSKPQSS